MNSIKVCRVGWQLVIRLRDGILSIETSIHPIVMIFVLLERGESPG